MSRLAPVTLACAIGCTAGPADPDALSSTIRFGAYGLRLGDDGTLVVEDAWGPVFDAIHLDIGSGTQDIAFATGSFQVTGVTRTVERVTRTEILHRTGRSATVALHGDDGPLGRLRVSAEDGHLALTVLDVPPTDDTPRLVLSYACDPDEAVLGLGAHALDVNHVGQAFPLWVSEPGIGKSTSDDPLEAGFPLEGTRHASSYPVPFLLRPQQPAGLMIDTPARIEVDLCATDPSRTELVVWDHTPVFRLFHGETSADVVRAFTHANGRMPRPPAWAFAPWITAIRGEDNLRDAMATLRDRDIPTSVIWTEDWKGADLLPTGFRLSEEWFADDTFYPDLSAMDDELEAQGFAWLAYFAPFLGRDTVTADDAIDAGVTLLDPDGTDPYWFLGVRFTDVTMVDLSTEAGRHWARGYMTAVRDAGFEGWMTDYAEWLPTDARLASGQDALRVHNDYPQWWQQTVAEVLDPAEHVWFCRSGWRHTAGTCPVVWLGDQRTSFEADDGLPSIVPLALGLSLSGIPILTHDIAGYQSATNPPSDRELWYRWAALGAYSPIMRTHHGSSKDDNHQWNADQDTLQYFARMAKEHTALFPYRFALADRASRDGTPILQPTWWIDPAQPYERADAWMLGEALLIVPVLERGQRSLDPGLPANSRWLDVHTGLVAKEGEIPFPFPPTPADRAIGVFQREGTVVPRFAVIPDTLRKPSAPVEGLIGPDEADVAREIQVFGTGGTFTEADGTTYTVFGTPTSSATVEATLTAGEVTVGGATVRIDGPIERMYRVDVVP